MTFDPTVSLGTIIHLVLLLIGLVGAYFGILRRIDRGEAKIDLLSQRLDMVWAWFKTEHNINGKS